MCRGITEFSPLFMLEENAEPVKIFLEIGLFYVAYNFVVPNLG